MKSKHNVHESAEKFKNSVKQIETEKSTKIAAFYNRLYVTQPREQYRPGETGPLPSKLRP